MRHKNKPNQAMLRLAEFGVVKNRINRKIRREF